MKRQKGTTFHNNKRVYRRGKSFQVEKRLKVASIYFNFKNEGNSWQETKISKAAANVVGISAANWYPRCIRFSIIILDGTTFDFESLYDI